MLNSYKSSLTYEIDSFNNNYYYQNHKDITRKTFNNFSTNLTNYFNSLKSNSRRSYKNDYYNLYNPYNNGSKKFSMKNIDFNKSSDQKILLTYKNENISRREITAPTQSVINLQSQMYGANSDNILDNSRSISTGGNKKNKTKRRSDNKFQSQENYNKKNNSLFKLSINNLKKHKIKKNRTISHFENKKKEISANNLIHKTKRINSSE